MISCTRTFIIISDLFEKKNCQISICTRTMDINFIKLRCYDQNYMNTWTFVRGFRGIILHSNEPRHDKTNKMNVRPATTRISLGIRPVWSESSLCAQWVAKDPSFLHADSEDSDQTGRMPKLIWVFVGRTEILLVLSCRGSNHWRRRDSLNCMSIFSLHVRWLTYSDI